MHFLYNPHEGELLDFILISLSPTSQQNSTVKYNKNIFLKFALKFCLLTRPSNVVIHVFLPVGIGGVAVSVMMHNR